MSKHALLMLACCLAPLALIVGVSAFGLTLDGILRVAMILLCPLLHILMMRGMSHDHAVHANASAHNARMAHGGNRADGAPSGVKSPVAGSGS